MQKNLSQSERYARGYFRNTLGNLAAGAIFILIAIIISLLNGCEPVLPNDSHNKKETLSSETDSTHEKQPDINEWNTDTTTYQSQAKPQ